MSAQAAGDLGDWLVTLELEGKADRSIYGYHRAVAALLRAYPDKGMGEFTPDDLELFLSQGSKRSRHITRSILNQWFLWAERKERVDRNPMVRVANIKHPERRQRDIFTYPEIAKLEALPSPHGQLFAILFGTGIRKLRPGTSAGAMLTLTAQG